MFPPGPKCNLRTLPRRLTWIPRLLLMRRLLHLFALLALVTTGLAQGMSMPEMLQAPGCVNVCKTSDAALDPCTVITPSTPSGSRAPSCPASTRSCSTRGGSVAAFTSISQKQNHERLERWIEPSPWPSIANETPVNSGPMDAGLVGSPAVYPSPDRLLERLAILGTFRI